MTLQVSEVAVNYHQQRVELGKSVSITKEQQIDLARQDFAAFFCCELQKYFLCRDDICLAIGLLDRQVKGQILLHVIQWENWK